MAIRKGSSADGRSPSCKHTQGENKAWPPESRPNNKASCNKRAQQTKTAVTAIAQTRNGPHETDSAQTTRAHQGTTNANTIMTTTPRLHLADTIEKRQTRSFCAVSQSRECQQQQHPSCVCLRACACACLCPRFACATLQEKPQH